MSFATIESPKGAEFHVAHEQYEANRVKNYNSKAKSLLYNEDQGKPVTPVRGGKACSGATQIRPPVTAGAPFATTTATMHDEEVADGKTHVAKPKIKEGAGKPNEKQEFDPDVYRQTLEANYRNLQASKARNYTGNNVFGT